MLTYPPMLNRRMTDATLPKTKNCNLCLQTKPLDCFSKSPANRGGHTTRCKPCCVEIVRLYRLDHVEERRAYSRQHYIKQRERRAADPKFDEAIRERDRRYHRVYYLEHRDALKADSLVRMRAKREASKRQRAATDEKLEMHLECAAAHLAEIGWTEELRLKDLLVNQAVYEIAEALKLVRQSMPVVEEVA